MAVRAESSASLQALLGFLVAFVILCLQSTQGAHFYRSGRLNVSERHSNGRLKDAMASKPEVKQYLAWVERVRAKYEGNAVSEGGFRLPVPLQGMDVDVPEDKVYSTLQMRVEKVITVSQVAGEGEFETVQAAVDAVPKNNVQRTIIQIAAGVYKEKVKIPKSKGFITLIGAGMNSTIITWDDTATSSASTFQSATFSVMAPGFVAKNVAFENTAPAPPPGAQGRQAVAFQISGDRAALYSCAFLGAQDTLYDHVGRHFFQGCWIQGSIDFVFGDGLSFYQDCVLYVIDTPTGSLTAQRRRSDSEDTGFAFVNCHVMGLAPVYLGRAWGAYSRVVFLLCRIDTLVLPGAWNDWGIPDREKTAFYGEYKCYGRGANPNNMVAWAHQLTDSEATPFLTTSFIDGQSWLSSVS